MPLPDFFVLGAARSGTTALYHALAQHPGVFMSPMREPLFFASDSRPPEYAGPHGRFRVHGAWRPHEYLAQFEGARAGQARGESSPLYLAVAGAARRIARNVPEARLVAVLRDPAARAYSHYWHMVGKGVEPAPTFEDALGREDERMRAGWFPGFGYRARGLYHEQLAPYLELFGADQLKIYLYEDWRASPRAVLRDLFAFLGADPSFEPALAEHNVSRAPRHRALHRRTPRSRVRGVRRKEQRLNTTAPPPLRADTRRRLVDGFRDDVHRLEALLGRDLSRWLAATP